MSFSHIRTEMSKFGLNNFNESFKKGKPYFGVIFLQFVAAGLNILTKTSLNEGMNIYVFVVYCHVAAFMVMAPFAIVLEKNIRPKMTPMIFIKLMILALLGAVVDHNLFFWGLKYTTVTFATAMYNIIPAITFVMACILRLEKVNIKNIHNQAKVIGTVVSIAGAMIMTLIKGPVVEFFWIKQITHHEVRNGGVDHHHFLLGAFFLVLGCFSWSAFTVLQAITLKSYPAELSMTAWICVLGTAEGVIWALIMERGNTSVWAIKWNTTLIATLYSGILCSGLAYYIGGVVMKDKGPVFVTLFGPLGIIIVAVMGSFILSEQIYLGGVIGAIVIVVGLYVYVWGKSKDSKDKSLPIVEQIMVEKQLPNNEFKENSYPKVVTIKASDGVSDNHILTTGLS